MRYLTSACPDLKSVLLVESGARPILESAIPRLRAIFGPATEIHLVTCFPGAPAGFGNAGRIWRTQDHVPRGARTRLIKEIRDCGCSALGIVCSDESIMFRWKWWLAWKLPVKVLVINENADCFWLDTAHLGAIRGFVKARAGLGGEQGALTLARLALLPFTFTYLLLYATIAHARRWVRRVLAFRTP